MKEKRVMWMLVLFAFLLISPSLAEAGFRQSLGNFGAGIGAFFKGGIGLLNAVIIFIIVFIIGKYTILKDGDDKQKKIIVITMIVLAITASFMGTRDPVSKQFVPLWQKPLISQAKQFFVGGNLDPSTGRYTPDTTGTGTYTDAAGIQKQGILKTNTTESKKYFNRWGKLVTVKGLPVFIAATLVLIFIFFVGTKGWELDKKWKAGMAVFFGAFIANTGSTKDEIVKIGVWAFFIIFYMKLKEKNPEKPGQAFGFAYALTMVIKSVLLEGQNSLGSGTIIWHLAVGMILGFLFDSWQKYSAAASERFAEKMKDPEAAKKFFGNVGKIIGAIPGVQKIVDNILGWWKKALKTDEAQKKNIENLRGRIRALIETARARPEIAEEEHTRILEELKKLHTNMDHEEWMRLVNEFSGASRVLEEDRQRRYYRDSYDPWRDPLRGLPGHHEPASTEPPEEPPMEPGGVP